MNKPKDINERLSGAAKRARFAERNNESVSLKGVKPGTMTADDDVMPLYDLDFSKAEPNRFAHREKIIVGSRGGARPGAGRKPAPEPLIGKKVYLSARHLRILSRVDKNLSAAIRKLVDARK